MTPAITDKLHVRLRKKVVTTILVFISIGVSSAGIAQGLNIELDGVTDDYLISSYSNRDGAGTVAISDDGNSITLDGDAWKRVSINYVVTSDTVLTFDYQSNVQGDRHGIGVDTNLSPNTTFFFKLHGTANWGRTEYNTYTAPGTQHFEIPLGELLPVRKYSYLVFMNENGGNGTYSNIKLFESGGSGEDGENGEDGMSGNSILSGSGSPDASDGGEGDFYIDIAANILYGPKSEVWSLDDGVPLVGPQGDTGAAGAPGAAGEPGAAGMPGIAGATGAAGPEGPVGPTGPEGPLGPEGPEGPEGVMGPSGAQTINLSIDATQFPGIVAQDFIALFPDTVLNTAQLEIEGICQGPVVVINGPAIEIQIVESSDTPPWDQAGLNMELPFVFEAVPGLPGSSTDCVDSLPAFVDNFGGSQDVRAMSLIVTDGVIETFRWNFFEFVPTRREAGLVGERYTFTQSFLPDRRVFVESASGDMGLATESRNSATDLHVEIEGITSDRRYPAVELLTDRTLQLVYDFNESAGIYPWVVAVAEDGTTTNGIPNQNLHALSVIYEEANGDEISRTNYFECFPIKYEQFEGFAQDIQVKTRVILNCALSAEG